MIQLKPLLHRDELCIAFVGRLTGKSYFIIKNFQGRMYSATHSCYYVVYTADLFRKIIELLKDVTELDISEWSAETLLPRDHAVFRHWVIIPSI